MSAQAASGPRGTPLALFAVLMAGWVSARVILWESPVLPTPPLAAAVPPPAAPAPAPALAPVVPPPAMTPPPAPLAKRTRERAPKQAPRVAAPRLARSAAQPLAPAPQSFPVAPRAPVPGASPLRPSPLPVPSDQAYGPRAARWSLDGWGFFRQGSDAAPISQGRVPIYGASQVGAVGQFRLMPSSRHDPRLYVRAYRALVARGESEGALGASIRPIPGVPLRAFAEVRYTDAAFASELRPSVFVVSELPPQPLPADFTLEAYGQAGWVGGSFATPFADGQVSLARELASVNVLGGAPLRLSAGAGAWGGAQKDAQRLDIGPTLRAEWRMGRVPARFSLDWRQQVAGDAAPESGLAATLSTSF